jgi:Protein of unknown function (DUF2865)
MGVRGGGGGRYVAYCVRLCDGHHFPLEHTANAAPIETCRAMCPASKTKVFFGSGIDHAAARDGQRYTDLDRAYAYRDHLVANCTCNGRDALGYRLTSRGRPCADGTAIMKSAAGSPGPVSFGLIPQ